MKCLPQDASARLVKLCGLLGSAHAGERAAAGLKADRLLVEHGVGWADLINTAGFPADLKSSRRAAYPERTGRPKPAELLREHQRQAWLLLACDCGWNEWERQFLSSIRNQQFEPSERQEAILRKCRRKADDWRKLSEVAP